MQAVDFIKKFGWGEAAKQLKDPKLVYGCQVDYEFMHDLKQFVGAWELVSLFGSDVSFAKKYLEEGISKFRYDMHFYVDDDLRSYSFGELKQAIALVEQVNATN